jgi:hypothetical protein
VNGQHNAPAALPSEEYLVSSTYEAAGWTTEPVQGKRPFSHTVVIRSKITNAQDTAKSNNLGFMLLFFFRSLFVLCLLVSFFARKYVHSVAVLKRHILINKSADVARRKLESVPTLHSGSTF